MELRHLRCFGVLAEELHFTSAAERLPIEQPPFSRTIKELEDDLKVMPFDRDRRGVWLTAAGAALLQGARRLLEQARENAKANAAGLRGACASYYPMARSTHNCPRIWPIAVKKSRSLKKGYPRFRWPSSCGAYVQATSRLDLHTPPDQNDIVAEPLSQDSLVIAVPARHKLLVRNPLPNAAGQA